jgi:hypothetical protein
MVILDLSLALTTHAALEGCVVVVVMPPSPTPTPPSPSLLGTLLAVHFSLLLTVANTSMLQNALAAPTSHLAAAAPAKPLDDLLHLPPEAAPVQEAIDLVKDEPLKAVVAPEL